MTLCFKDHIEGSRAGNRDRRQEGTGMVRQEKMGAWRGVRVAATKDSESNQDTRRAELKMDGFD